MTTPTGHVQPPALEELRRLAMLVEYDGEGYHGFQAQENARTIQDTLEEAIYSFTGERLRIRGAGRTDAGVHAWGQVIAFDTWALYPPATFLRALNHYLPEQISIRDAREVSLDFDPRRWAIGREYCYRILNTPTSSPLLRKSVYHVRKPLDIVSMQKAAKLLETETDFAPFSGPLPGINASTKRNMFSCSVSEQAGIVALKMYANAFLPQQVRRTAGALLDVGLGRLNLREFRDLAECGKLGAAYRVLPAQGLFLVKVEYPVPLFHSLESVDVQERPLTEMSII